MTNSWPINHLKKIELMIAVRTIQLNDSNTKALLGKRRVVGFKTNGLKLQNSGFMVSLSH